MEKEQFILDFIESPEKYYLEDDSRISIGVNPIIKLEDVVFYRIDRITYEDKAPHKEALENVLSAMRIPGVNFLYLIKGDKTGVSFYYGISRDLIQKIPLEYEIDEYGELILKPGIESNFRGSKITRLTDEAEQTIIDDLSNMKYIGNLDGVPGINDDDDENYQGVDRMVDVMLGDEFAFLVTAKALPSKVIRNFENNIYSFYDQLFPISKKNVQKGNNWSETKVDTVANGDNDSTAEAIPDTTTKNYGKSTQESRSSTTEVSSREDRTEGFTSTDNTKTYSKTTGKTTTTTKGHSKTTTIGTNKNEGESKTTTYEFTNKEAQEWIKYIDDVLLKRLDYGKGKGIYISTITLFTMGKAQMLKLENTATALFSGESGNKVPLRKVELVTNGQRQALLRNFQIPIANFAREIQGNEVYTRTILSQYATKERAFLGNWFSVNELSIIAGLPQKEIVGLALREEVEFGLNYIDNIKNDNKLPIGHLVQSGNELDIPIYLDKKELKKHTFITGVTGAGKTTTCHKLLLESNSPFLVIEPAKTEYRELTKHLDDIVIFTLGKEKVAPFRLNPFEFYKHESITSHVDMIMASIKSAFDMEHAMPNLIESAIYEAYKAFGWDVKDNSNQYYTFDDIENGAYAFPTISDVISMTEKVVKVQGFDDRLEKDYLGSIKARLQALTIGAKGLMLNTRRSIDFRDLLHKKVIIELEEIRSAEEKALIMGFILANLMEAIKVEYNKDSEFYHMTLVEEAHRLLSKYEPGDSLSKKNGVEMFADMLAEVRKYGEALVIVDQIPNKMTPEVLKNTNTKIVHKIFAQDDKEAIGNTMALSDEQKEFLSFLDVGRTIVFSQGWDSSLQVKVEQCTNTSNKEIIDEQIIRNRALDYYCGKYYLGVFPSLKCCDGKPDAEMFEKHIKYRAKMEKLLECYQKVFADDTATDEFKQVIKELEDIMSVEKQARYVRDMFYIYDENDVKLNKICSMFMEIKNNNYYVGSYSEALGYGRRRSIC